MPKVVHYDDTVCPVCGRDFDVHTTPQLRQCVAILVWLYNNAYGKAQ